MGKKRLARGAWAAGGAALLTVASVLCIKGMEAAGRRLQAKETAKAVKAEAELFEDFTETEATEDAAEEEIAE